MEAISVSPSPSDLWHIMNAWWSKDHFEKSHSFDAPTHWTVCLIFFCSWGNPANFRKGKLRTGEKREMSVFIRGHGVPTHKSSVLVSYAQENFGRVLAAGRFTWPQRKGKKWHKCQGQRQGKAAKYRFRTIKICVIDRSEMPNPGASACQHQRYS